MVFRNVKVHTSIPESSIIETSIGLHQTYLDTIGRTAVTVRARNLVDDFRDRDLIISYDMSMVVILRKPFIIFASMMGLYITAWTVGKIETGFSKT